MMLKMCALWVKPALAGFLFLLCAIASVHAQQVTLQGTVRDAKGPMVGVTVSVEGGATQVQTDEQGAYRISAPANSAVIYRFLGYEEHRLVLAELGPDNNGIYTAN